MFTLLAHIGGHVREVAWLLGCPDCPPVRAARAAIADDPDRWVVAFAVAAPFIVAALFVSVVIRGGRSPSAEKQVRSWSR